MSGYRVVTSDEVFEQLEALPGGALPAYAEALVMLELAPWNGPSNHRANPDGAVRRVAFGPGLAGHVVYLVLDDRREVHVLLVQWMG